MISDIPLGLPVSGPEASRRTRVVIRVFDPSEQSNRDCERFEIDDRAYFLSARDGSIFYRADGSMTESATAREILDVVLPELLSLLGMVVLHASVVSRDQKSIVLTGSSGAGKSTLARSLEQHGWTSGADDFVIVRDDLRVEHFGGPIRIWPDVEIAIGENASDRSIRGKAILDRPWDARVNEIAAVVILSDPVEGDAALLDIGGSFAFNQLIRACFRKAPSGEAQLRHQIDVISRLVDERLVRGLSVPRGLNRIRRTAREVSVLFEGLIA